MNQYSILKMAREAGLLRGGDGWTMPHRWGITELERFAALIAAAEREVCAEMVEGMNVQHPKYIAAAIRARGEK